MLVDGHHRYRICQKHDIPFDTKEMQFDSLGDACMWAWKHQQARRNCNPYDRVEPLLACEALIANIEAKAKERQRAGGQIGGKGGRSKAVQDSAQASGKTRREVARFAGVSHDTVEKAKVIRDKADEPTKERLRRGDTTIHAGYKRIHTDEKAAARPGGCPARAGSMMGCSAAGLSTVKLPGAIGRQGLTAADSGSRPWSSLSRIPGR